MSEPDPYAFPAAFDDKQQGTIEQQRRTIEELRHTLVEWEALKKQAQALLNVRTAWELYRSGGATLEEITPLMDEAVAQAELGQARPTIPEVEARSPAGNNVLPRELAKIGQCFRFDGKLYRVKSFEAQYAVLVQVDNEGKFVSDGSPLGKLSIRVEGTMVQLRKHGV